MIVATWQNCVNSLRNELPTQQFNTWIRPLKAVGGGNQLSLLAPNKFILEWVKDNFLDRIQLLMGENYSGDNKPVVILELASDDRPASISNMVSSSDLISPFVSEPDCANDGNAHDNERASDKIISVMAADAGGISLKSGRSLTGEAPEIRVRSGKALQTDRFGRKLVPAKSSRYRGELNSNYTFSNFIEGKSNQLARAASAQVASNPGSAYNPLFIYGGVGLGKTHLMHAIGNHIKHQNPDANVVYLHSQVFVNSMVSALQLNAINEFKRFYHSVDALLIDDIQFFANKERSQEEFFHTFNAIFEGGRQIIMTCDKYYNQINGLEERLKSRFGWGLSVAVEPPELETRAAILINKANHDSVYLSNEAAMFMAQKLRSNVRELEGALKKVVAHSRFVGEEISIPLIKEALKDLLAIQNRLVTIDNIQRTVSEYYKIKMSDMLSKRRSRSVARPRQVAMCLSKELTNHSLPEIGNHYGGRDHTTVLHACRTIHELCKTSVDIHEDYQNLLRILSS